MKKIIPFLLISILAQAEELGLLAQAEELGLLAQAEELVYNVKTFGINIGTQRIEAEEKPDKIIIISETKTNKFFSRFYRIDDYIETYIDKKTLLPTRIIEKIDENKEKKEISTELFQEKLKAVVKENGMKNEITLKNQTFNIPSLIYYLRHINQKGNFSLITAGKVEEIEIDIEEKRLKHYVRKVSGNGVIIYFTEDNIPIMIETRLKCGLTLCGYLK